MKQDLPSFDTLLRIAQEDPEELEQLRERLAQSTIDSAPHYMQARLRGLQFQIDLHRNRAKTPLSACIQLTRMMHESFFALRDALNGPAPGVDRSPVSGAEIIPFPSR